MTLVHGSVRGGSVALDEHAYVVVGGFSRMAAIHLVCRFAAVRVADPGTWFIPLAEQMARLPDSPYLEWLMGTENPDLSSGISLEIPAFEDPELQKTIKAALAMAAAPDRVHFAVCLQGGTDEDAAFLDSMPNCRYVRYAADEAPGSCAARADCQGLTGDEAFVLRLDSHMRFAWGWDVALIRQWQECGDPDAILTEHPLDYCNLVREPVDSVAFTRYAMVGTVCVLGADYFEEASLKLRIRCRCTCKSEKPVRGAFTAGGMCFMTARSSRLAPFDRNMYFVADECSMAVRHYTNGQDVYHPYVMCVYHLYDRARFAKGTDGLTRRDRETMRLLELFGLSPGNQYGLSPGTTYGFGTDRTLHEFEAFAGISFRDMSIRRFAHEGRFDVEHDPSDMEFVDWVAECRSEGDDVLPGLPPVPILDKELLDMLKGWQKSHGTPMELLVRWAVSQMPDQAVNC